MTRKASKRPSALLTEVELDSLPSYEKELHIRLSPDQEYDQHQVACAQASAVSQAASHKGLLSADEKPKPLAYKPSIKLMFSLSTRRELSIMTLPAFLISAAAALVPPYLTIVLGRAFSSFSQYVLAQRDSTVDLGEAKRIFYHQQLVIFINLIVLAFVTFIASSISLALWNLNAEFIVRRLRTIVFERVIHRDLAWFDLGAGIGKETDDTDGGSAALSGRFARDTDEVRMATGQTFGLTVQSIFTAIFCIILAFVRAPQLAPVVLVTFPLVVFTTGIVEKLAGPLVEFDRDQEAAAASKVERAISAIATVKAFNAEKQETDSFLALSERMRRNYNKLTMYWGFRIGISQFFLLMSFVQGFWFGNYLVNKGTLTGGRVTEVFWACMLASTSIQSVVPLLNIITLGRHAMAGLLNLTHEDEKILSPPNTANSHDLHFPMVSPPVSPTAAIYSRSKSGTVRNLRKIQPDTLTGELTMSNVTFHYPTRPYPHPPVLRNVSLFIPAREMTFIIGQSGSGKSTIGALLMSLYRPDTGSILADDQDLRYLDETWLRSHVAMVSQGASVLFEGTIHDNVALGALTGLPQDPIARKENLESVSRAKVIEACRIALIHDFIRDLPDGYDTHISGEKGASLSGGQRQRLAIARAYLRDPTVLILDEATSALDATSRLLLYEAIKRWRNNKTTVVITHDLSPIQTNDFVYVIEDGRVLEEGYKHDLETDLDSHFYKMTTVQHAKIPDAKFAKQEDVERLVELPVRQSSLAPPSSTLPTPRSDSRASYFGDRPPSHAWFGDLILPDATPRQTYLQSGMPLLELAANNATSKRVMTGTRRQALEKTEKASNEDTVIEIADVEEPVPSLFKTMAKLLPCLPNKLLLALGYAFCVICGLSLPIFSTLLAKMLSSLGTPGFNSDMIKTGLLIVLVATLDGLGIWMKYSLLQRVAMNWVCDLRRKTYIRLLMQDKTWFDTPQNSAIRIANTNVKDVSNARDIIGMISGQFFIVIIMLLFGLIWALVTGWQLTLIGLGVAPVILVVLIWQTKFLGRHEMYNKAMRDNLTSKFHQAAGNIRAIRAMSIEAIFISQYADVVASNHKLHVRTAFYTGITYSIGQAMNIVMEGVMLFVGALFVRSGLYTFERMLQVFSLIIFSITFAAQTLSYVPALTRCIIAAAELLRLYELSEDTLESKGKLTQPIDGHVTFSNVHFAYPSRPDVAVSSDLSFSVSRGECVGLVGASGSGKSTITALLQRLYQPISGDILLDETSIMSMSTHYLRSHIAVVSQHPALFDMSVADNIAYGSSCSFEEIVKASKSANAHDFIMHLPHQYDTNLGENASLISGGQAQRIQLARAIVKEREVLILDECTSALDPANQAIIMETIKQIKEGRTTLIVTHKLDLMKMCDRLLVMEAGKVVESGTFEELVATRGTFATLAASGEWQA